MKLPEEPRDPDQWWYWLEQWQAGERQADKQIKLGQSEKYWNDIDFLRSLDEPYE